MKKSATRGLLFCSRRASKLPPAARLQKRKTVLAPFVDEFFAWGHAQNDLTTQERGLVTKALGYAIRQELALRRFLDDGRLRMDNNNSESALRIVATGRKAWHSPEGIRSGTMWAWTNALWVSFFYSPAGDSESVQRFLGEDNLARDVQADGTNILTFIERAGGKRPGCWAHARRGLVRCARSGDRVAFEGVMPEDH